MLKRKIKINCKVCDKTFLDYFSNYRKYCSMQCRNIGWSEILKHKHPRYWLGKHRSKKTKIKLSKNIVLKNRVGRLHPSWKGDDVKCEALHKRIERIKGKPKFCEFCKTNDKNKVYHWASLNHQYADINSYKRLCVSCHKKYDNLRRKNEPKKR